MAIQYPSTSYACPCSDLTSPPPSTISRRTSVHPSTIQLDEDQTFNPHSPRANHALYPLDHLLYCDECDALRCPRCWTEEVLYWYCPMCLFEVPSSAVKGDGNRCSRSCYACPSCTSQLVVTQITGRQEEALSKPGKATADRDTYILQCPYCDWSSLEIDLQFDRPTKITEQISRLRKARTTAEQEKATSDAKRLLHEDAFANLATFYKEQLSDTTDPQNPYSNSPYSSPANLARIMSLYGGLPYNALKKSKEKTQPMREAMQPSEGLRTYTDPDSDASIIRQMQSLGWDHTSSADQRNSTPTNHDARFTDQLWPAAAPLRTRRGKRCKACRQFLTRPEGKVGSMKYRIRLLAVNHIPRLSIRPFLQQQPSTSASTTNPAFHLRAEEVPTPELLQPYQTKQYILTVRNPLFESVHISLATPATTPGKVASRVTILCPTFTVGPAGELWDDALASTSNSSTISGDGGRSAAMASLTGSMADSSMADRQPEAGKIWTKTRNSTSVVMEIVPGSVSVGVSRIVPGAEEHDDTDGAGEDEDVLEVPVYVRAEWEVEVKLGESTGKRKFDADPGAPLRKELGYWVVLSVGRVAS